MGTKFLNTLVRGIAMLTFISMIAGNSLGGTLPALAAPGDTTRVSVDSSGTEANGGSNKPAVSDDGRFVAFQSGATNLVSGDTNNVDDIFVHDRQTGTTTRVSVDSNGSEANGGSSSPATSADGRFVAFYSDASNLVNGDNNGCGDIFVHDHQTGQTTRVSVDSNGNEQNAPPDYDYAVVSISGDGRYIAFYSDATNLVSGDTNGETDIFVHDRQTSQTFRASVASDGTEANASSTYPSLSGDGRFVTFSSGATNLVAGDTNGKGDVFVRDIQSGITTLVSVNSMGEQADGGGFSPDISGDGRYVVFLSKSHNLDPRAEDYGVYPLAYVRDLQVGQTMVQSVSSTGDILPVGDIDMPVISRNGRYVAFEFRHHGDPYQNTWARDLQTGTSVAVTYHADGDFWPVLSANGSVVAFQSDAASLVSGDSNGVRDVFVSEVDYGPERDPTAFSVTPDCGFYLCPRPTPAEVNFIATFSEQVTGVTVDDFSLTMLDGVSGASIIGVSGYGSQYLITVNTGTGDGKLRLDLVDNDSILDSALNPLGGAGAGNGNKTGKYYYVEKSAPTVTSITLADPNPTAAEQVNFTVTFSEKVWPVNPGDFVLTSTGSISGAAVTAIDPGEDEYRSENTYTVTVNTGTGDGTLRLDLIDDDSIRDDLDNPLGGPGIGNGDFTTGETYTIAKSAPSAPSVTSSLRADPNPTAADNVNFTVTFSEAVSGVDLTDFSLATTGISGAFVTNVSGAGNTYTVTAGTGSGNGSLRLDVMDDDSIQNTFGTPLGGTGAGNGNFTTGETYTIEKSVPGGPSVTGSLRADSNPTTADVVSFTVSFSEAVSGVDSTDFSLSTSGNISGASITGISGSGAVYSVTVATGSGNGTIRLDILDDDSIVGTSGYPLGGAGTSNGNFTAGETYTINRVPAHLLYETIRSNGRNDGWVLEVSENAEQGGYKDPNSATFVLGDDNQNRQFRSILHFPTYYLPNNAVITRALLMLKREALVGTDPFQTHQNIVVDIRSGAFGFIGPFQYRGLQVSDFQSPSSADAVSVIENNPLNDWYYAWLDGSAFEHVNLNGITQIRLRFQIDDDNDLENDYLRFYSGDSSELSYRPQLVFEYYRR